MTGPRCAAEAVVAAALVIALAGCGSPPADLFVVTRSGSVPGASLRLRVDDGGNAHCNRARAREITSAQLLQARELARQLGADAERHLRLPPGRGSVLRYSVRLEQGTVSFADDSRGLRPEMARLALFTRQVAKQACGLAR